MTEQNRMNEWDCMELERLYEDAYDEGSGMGAKHALLVQWLCEHGHSVSNTARALRIAEHVLWGEQ